MRTSISLCRSGGFGLGRRSLSARTLSSNALAPVSRNRLQVIYQDLERFQKGSYCEEQDEEQDEDQVKYQDEYSCDLKAESLSCYRPGGYHPVHLGDTFADGRYTIIGKLGYGWHATVWAASDRRNGATVALKINRADACSRSTEIGVLQQLQRESYYHPGKAHLPQILDHFLVDGPNGLHQCIVTDFAGCMLGDYVRQHQDGRLPGNLLKPITRQLLSLADCLHADGVAHGNMHCENVTLVQDVADIVLGNPDTVAVSREGGQAIAPGVPHYLVDSIWNSFDENAPDPQIRVIGFGEAFHDSASQTRLHTPSVCRPPEALFGDNLDHRADLWAIGCMMFEMLVGQPIFNTPDLPVVFLADMIGYIGRPLPQRWAGRWAKITQDMTEGPFRPSRRCLQDVLQELYYNETHGQVHKSRRLHHFSSSQLLEAGSLITKLLRLEPKERLAAKDALLEPWLMAN